MPSPTYEILWSRAFADEGYVMWVRYPTIQMFTSWRAVQEGAVWVLRYGRDPEGTVFETLEDAKHFAETSYALAEES